MKVYELMSLLEKLPAGKEVKVRICITLDELMHGQLIDEATMVRPFMSLPKLDKLMQGQLVDEDCYALNLDVDDVTPESGTIETTL